MANKLNRAFSKEEIQMDKIYMKKCSTSLATKEMQIKTTLGFYFSSVRMAVIKNTTTNVGETVGKNGPSYSVDGNVN
jgi:hypothetical protein